MDLNRVLITGADGVVGSYVDFGIKTDKSVLDVTDLESVRAAVKKYQPEAILHLAALTNTKLCEQEPELADQINAVGTYQVALAAQESGATMIYLSTNDVFSGKARQAPYDESAAPDPTVVYGRSKYLGELAVRALVKKHLIVRTAWVFGGGVKKDKRFVGNIVKQFSKESIAAVTDQIGSPTYAKDLAAALKELIIGKKSGVVHVANSGPAASRFDIAKEIAAILKPSLAIKPVLSRDFDANLIAANRALKSSVSLRSWKEALADYLRIEWKTFDS